MVKRERGEDGVWGHLCVLGEGEGRRVICEGSGGLVLSRAQRASIPRRHWLLRLLRCACAALTCEWMRPLAITRGQASFSICRCTCSCSEALHERSEPLFSRTATRGVMHEILIKRPLCTKYRDITRTALLSAHTQILATFSSPSLTLRQPHPPARPYLDSVCRRGGPMLVGGVQDVRRRNVRAEDGTPYRLPCLCLAMHPASST